MPHRLTLRDKKFKGAEVYYPLHLSLVPKPTPGPNEILVKMHATALNHRDIFIRQNMYPDVSLKAPLMSDGCGEVVEEGPGCKAGLLRMMVVMTVCRGWKTSLEGPEDWLNFATVGGTGPNHDLGMAQNYLVINESEAEPCPEYLTPLEGAALPSCGITAWRALMIKSGNAEIGRNILVTGIGGGVALQVLQMGVELGCNIYVTSSSDEKIAKAQRMGAKGGVLYTNDGWPAALSKLLPSERPHLDAVIDGAGRDIVIKTTPILKPGGVIACYGMTLSPLMDWPMQAVLKNIELKGCTLGSRVEFTDMLNFIEEKQIKPVISQSVKGLDCVDAIEGLFDDMKAGRQFGKLVIEI